VNGTRFYNDPRDVAGSLVSTYQSPFVNFAWTARPGLTWKAEYNFYGYGEGGPSGAALCSFRESHAYGSCNARGLFFRALPDRHEYIAGR
jgi:hypothetical protein